MEPATVVAGKRGGRVVCQRVFDWASMEPATVVAGKLPGLRPNSMGKACFNGASDRSRW